MKREDVARLGDMLVHARKARALVGDTHPQHASRDEDRVLAVVACMIFVGEAAANLSEDLRQRLPDVPFRQAKLLRNMLVHRYFEINAEELFATAINDVPPLIARLEQLLAEEPSA